MKKLAVLAVAIAGVFVLSGCMAGYESTYDHPHHQMTIKDIDTLSSQGVSDSLIIAQIHSTHSVFHLSTNDILALKKAGVSETVISAMLATNEGKATRWVGYYPDYYYLGFAYDWWGWPYYYYPGFYSPAFYGGYYHPFVYHGGFHGGRGRR